MITVDNQQQLNQAIAAKAPIIVMANGTTLTLIDAGHYRLKAAQ